MLTPDDEELEIVPHVKGHTDFEVYESVVIKPRETILPWDEVEKPSYELKYTATGGGQVRRKRGFFRLKVVQLYVLAVNNQNACKNSSIFFIKFFSSKQSGSMIAERQTDFPKRMQLEFGVSGLQVLHRQ